ncbi:MAG: hypothetical protein APR63_14830 [Desulfuromonas sp. SDB]|nr:MAG: hypothetical protein APR63_14830 [Desulfuromonas sp. SDB]
MLHDRFMNEVENSVIESDLRISIIDELIENNFNFIKKFASQIGVWVDFKKYEISIKCDEDERRCVKRKGEV